MRRAGLFIVLVILSYALTAYVLGGQIEHHYFQSLDELNTSGLVQATNVGYHRGLFHSQSQTLLKFTTPPWDLVEENSDYLLLDHDFLHGPWPVKSLADLGSSGPKMAIIKTQVHLSPEHENKKHWQPSKEEILIIGYLPFSGPLQGHLSWPGDQGPSVLEADFVYDYIAKIVQVHASCEQAFWQIKDHEFALKDVHAELSLNNSDPSFYGQLVINIDTFTAFLNQLETWSLEKIQVQFNSSGRQNLFQILQQTAIDKIKFGDNQWGSLQWEISFNNIYGPMWGYWKKQWSIWQLTAKIPDFFDLSSEQIRAFLSSNPEIAVHNLLWTTPYGQLNASLRAAMHPPGTWAFLNPFLLLPYLELDADLSAHETLARRFYAHGLSMQDILVDPESNLFEHYLQKLVAGNFIVRDQDMLRSRLKYKQARLEINGHAFSWFK